MPLDIKWPHGRLFPHPVIPARVEEWLSNQAQPTVGLFTFWWGLMSWDVLVAAIKQKEALHPDEKVARVTLSEEFFERIKLDKNAVIGSAAISPTEVELHLLGYPLSIQDMQPDFLISMSPR